MPPIRKFSGPRRKGEHSAKVTRQKTFRYKRGTSRGATSGKKANSNNISLTTLSKKQENLSISYREMVDFLDMGGDNGSSPAVIRVNLNNPVSGGDSPAVGSRLVEVVSGTKPGYTAPTALHHSYNDKRNLASRLQEYFSIYRSAIVTSAECTVVVTPKVNQTTGLDGGRSVVTYLSNRTSEDASVAGQDTYLYAMQPNAMSQVVVWAVRQQNTAQLLDGTNGSPAIETLKQGIPGMKMQTLNITPNSKKGVTYKMKYTPKSQYGFSDWKDNKELLQVFKNSTGNPSQKEAYMYVGIGGRHRGADPVASGTGYGLPHFTVEVKVKYNINFSERLNLDGNNEPTPHADEL